MRNPPSSWFYILQEKDKEKKEKEKDAKEKEKKVLNGHQFTPVASLQGTQCSQCNKAFSSKEAFHCTREYLTQLSFFLSPKSCFIVCSDWSREPQTLHLLGGFKDECGLFAEEEEFYAAGLEISSNPAE